MMNRNYTLKQCACDAKSRLLKNDSLPAFVGRVPFSKYEYICRYVGDAELLERMCRLIECEPNEKYPLKRLIDWNYYESLSPTDRERYVCRLAMALSMIKNIYSNLSNSESKGERIAT